MDHIKSLTIREFMFLVFLVLILNDLCHFLTNVIVNFINKINDKKGSADNEKKP